MNYFFESQHNSVEFSERKNLDFTAHLHNDLELGYLKEGSCNLYVDGAEFLIKKGDFFLIFPNQIHCFQNSNNIIALFMIFAPEFVSEYRKVLTQQIPSVPIITNAEPSAVEILKLLQQVADNKNPQTIRALILALFSVLMESVQLIKTIPYNIDTPKKLLMYCEEHYTEPINIDDAAKALHISRSHISHVFKYKLFSTFERYISKKRIEYACSILANSNESITSVAYKSGFDSIRTFNRAFTKHMNCSPREYRKYSVAYNSHF